MGVTDVIVGATDPAGAVVEEVYAKFVPRYAVYRTKARVLIQFADDPDADQAQRKALLSLNPARGEISGLMDSWRSSRDEAVQSAIRRYERRAADALIVGLEGDTVDALALLQAVKADLLDERQSTGRRQYLLVGLAAATAVLILAGAGEAFGAGGSRAGAGWSVGQLLGLAAAGGAVGALLSIALGIRGRTVLTDLRFIDNAIDAALRVLVGVIAAPALICLALSGAAELTVGSAVLGPRIGAAPQGWLVVLIMAFVAGFLERLVPDLLAKAATGAPAPSGTPSGSMAPVKAAPGLAGLSGTAATASSRTADPDATDGCASGIEPEAVQATADADLPAAKGG